MEVNDIHILTYKSLSYVLIKQNWWIITDIIYSLYKPGDLLKHQRKQHCLHIVIYHCFHTAFTLWSNIAFTLWSLNLVLLQREMV